MSRLLLLADSNFVNNIGEFRGRKIEELEVKSCQSRKAAMSEINSFDEGIAVVACLDMVAADIIGTTTDPSDAGRAIEVYYNQLLFKLIEKVDDADGKVAFGVMAPLFWTNLPAEAKRAMNHTYKLMRPTSLKNIVFADYLKEVQAGADGTHLTKRSASRYIQRINDLFGQVAAATGLGPVVFLVQGQPEQAGQTVTDWAEDVAMQDSDAVTDLGPPAEAEGENGPPLARTTTMLSASILLPPSRQTTMLPADFSGRRLEDTQSRLMQLAAYTNLSVPPPTVVPNGLRQGLSDLSGLANLERRVGMLEDTTFHNNLMMAALKEEQDTEANKAMLNRVTFSGVVIENLLMMSESDRVKAMKDKVMEFVELLKDPESEQTFELLFVKHLNNQVRGQKTAVIEAKFADSKQTRCLRSRFVEKHKELSLKINITPVVRIATRVRVEMMHSIANLLLRHDASVVKAMCVQFIPKPVIKVVRKSAGGSEMTRTMTFTESIIWVQTQGLQRAVDLVKARARAGASFRGTLAQHFVLMD